MFHQTDLFDQSRPELVQALAPERESERGSELATPRLPDLVNRISITTKRPRYALLVLKLIAQEAGTNGSLGPYVSCEEGRVPVRDWLCQALAPLAKRDCRRLAMVEAVRSELLSSGGQPDDPAELERQLDEEVQARIMRSGRTSISRAVSDLVRAGLLRRHYQGFRVDHPNRGAQREAVYTITTEVQRAFCRH